MPYPVSTSPQSIAHLRVVIERLRQQITDAGAGGGGSGSSLTTSTGTVALTAGDVVYADGAGTLDKAQADSVTTSKIIGVVDTDSAMAAAASVTVAGIVTVAAWSLTTNTIYYLDPTTAGAITATAPTTVGEVVVPVGIAVSATSMRLLNTPRVLL